jgi:hypothetical protein
MVVALAAASLVAAIILAAIGRVEGAERYATLSIIAPANEETVHDNLGTVQVRVSIEPPLQTHAGHRLRIVLDGQPIAELSSAQPHTLRDVERGTHVLSATVIDRADAELIASESVTFHMWRASLLFPQRPHRPAPSK